MYFIYRIVWSQTDHDTVIVRAPAQDAAEAIVHNRFGGPHGACYIEQRGSTDKMIDDSPATSVTIPVEDYIQLKVGAERDSRFFEWDISCNWSDYDSALNDTSHDDEALNIEDFEAELRKHLSEIDLSDAEAVLRWRW